jgi:hypothetical protein
MHQGRIVFAQLMDYLPKGEFRRCVKRYGGDRYVKRFSCWSQFLSMAFAQLTYRESLRDIETCMDALGSKLYHAGMGTGAVRNTLSHANSVRSWKIYADFAQVLIEHARRLYRRDAFALELDETLYALDATTIDLCLKLFPWATFRKRKGAIKLHTLLDLKGNIPSFLRISAGNLHEVNILDELIFEAGSFYIMDRGYLDFERLYRLHQFHASFVVRAKTNLQYRRLYSRRVNRSTGLRYDQIIRLTGPLPSKYYPEKLRLVKFYDQEHDLRLVILTNNFSLPALTIAQLYKSRWQIELFFKWIKQHLRIKAFYGTSENAVKTQIWIAVSVYVLVAIVKKELRSELSLYTILQILSVTLFEKDYIAQLLTETSTAEVLSDPANQLSLFDF